MPEKVRTDTMWEKNKEHWSMTQHNHKKQAVNLWSMQVLLNLDTRVSRGIAVTQFDIKFVLLSGNDIWRLGFRTISPA